MNAETLQHVDEMLLGKLAQPEGTLGEPFWPLKERISNLNVAFQDIWEDIQDQDSGFFLPTVQIPLLAGTTEYALPASHSFLRRVWKKIAGGSTEDRMELARLSLDEVGRRSGFAVEATDEFSDAAGPPEVTGITPLHRIIVNPGIASTGYVLEVLFGKAPYWLTWGEVPAAAGLGNDDQIVLAGHEPKIRDCLVGSRLYLSEGMGAGAAREVTAFDPNAATGTATLASDWPGTPAPVTPDATSVYTSLVPLPPRAIKVMLFEAAMLCLANEQAPQMAEMKMLRDEARIKMEYSIAQLNRHAPPRVRDTAGYLDWSDGSYSTDG